MNKGVKILLVVLLVVALASTLSYCTAPFDTEVARITESKKTITGSGFILRRETVISNEIQGVFEPLVKDGERVPRNAGIGSVISGTLDKSLAKRLEDVNSRIDEIRKTEGVADLYASDDARIINHIRDLAGKVRENAENEEYGEAEAIKNQLNAVVERKYSGEGTKARDELLVSLEAEKYNLEESLGGVRSEILAPCAGFFYKSLDGLEPYGDEDYLKKLTLSRMKEFSKTLREYTPEKNDVGKITDSYAWYLVSAISREDAKKLHVGETISISIDEMPSVSVQVLSLNDDEAEDEVLLCIKSTKSTKGILEKRTAEFEIVTEAYRGIYVPSEAVRVADDVTGVYVLSKNKAISFRCIKIIAKMDNYYIADDNYTPLPGSPYKPLGVYDDILVNPEAVK